MNHLLFLGFLIVTSNQVDNNQTNQPGNVRIIPGNIKDQARVLNKNMRCFIFFFFYDTSMLNVSPIEKLLELLLLYVDIFQRSSFCFISFMMCIIPFITRVIRKYTPIKCQNELNVKFRKFII